MTIQLHGWYSCETHVDSSLLTILWQGDVGGLQVMAAPVAGMAMATMAMVRFWHHHESDSVLLLLFGLLLLWCRSNR
jgi:isopenicillin N synthase-like dioxygenase